MGNGTMNWDNAETWERIVAAIMATSVKVDLTKTAEYYGTTYNTLENRFRKTKKLAAELKEAVDSGKGADTVKTKATPSTPRTAKTPKKDVLGSVSNGRVGKSTPSKKGSAVKQEQMESAATSFMGDFVDDGHVFSGPFGPLDMDDFVMDH